VNPGQPATPSRSAAEDHARWLRLVYPRYAIGREPDNRGITTLTAVAETLGMPAAEATALMARRQSREGNLVQLEAAAARLGCRRPTDGAAFMQALKRGQRLRPQTRSPLISFGPPGFRPERPCCRR
jgi:hypothetical protein